MSEVVDIYALPIPKTKVRAYQKISRAAGKVFRKHGVTDYREFLFEGPAEMSGAKAFTAGVRLKRGEVLVTAIVAYPSAAARRRINKAIVADPELGAQAPDPGVFDMKRMIVGRFKTIVDV